MVLALYLNAYRPFRTSRVSDLLAGAVTLATGLHTLAGQHRPLVGGYGFAVLGVVAMGYTIYVWLRDESVTDANI